MFFRVIRIQVENVHVVWLQAEHVQTSPFQPPASANVCPTPTPSAVGVYLGRLSVAATIASATTAARESSNSPARGGGGDGASGTKERPRSGVPAAPETAGVKKDIELDDFVAYTKESTADWFQDVPPSDSEDGDGGIYSGGEGIRLRPVPPLESVAAGACVGATTDAAAASPAAAGPTAADVTAAAAAAAAGSPPSPAERKGNEGAERTGSCRAETTPVFIVRPLRVRGALVIRERGAAAAQAVPKPQAGGRSKAATGEDSPNMGGGAGANGDGAAGVVEPPPLVKVALDVEAIALQVDVRQYAVLNAAVSALTMSQRRFKFRTMRPTTSVLSDPEAWWRYSIR